ncbi:hypothetical protein IC582_000453 [Cucumis melo]
MISHNAFSFDFIAIYASLLIYNIYAHHGKNKSNVGCTWRSSPSPYFRRISSFLLQCTFAWEVL